MKVDEIPNFTITPRIINQVKSIDSLRSSCKGIDNKRVDLRLRKASLIRSINSSLFIEGNTLDLMKVHDIINGKTVEGPFDEIHEVKNALNAYASAEDANLWSVDDFIRIQDEMTWATVEKPGFRDEGVCVAEGDVCIYKAPHHTEVGPMIDRLFDWCMDSDYDPPITGAIAHYYIESIHPFQDGNGRMGRLWHYSILHRYDPIFDLLPIEMMISRHQMDYYQVLERCQHTDPQDCTEFIEFCLDLNIESLTDLAHLKDQRTSDLLSAMGDKPMTSAQIMKKMGLSSKQHFLKNYLRPAVERGFVSMSDPDHPRSSRQTYTKRIL